MYCKNCGAENLSAANYCIHDGTLLKRQPSKYRFIEQQASFCSNCGLKMAGSDNYCSSCGASHAEYTREKSIMAPKDVGNLATYVPKKLAGLDSSIFKKALLPALIAILIVFTLSFGMMKSSEKLYQSLLDDSLQKTDVSSFLYDFESATNSHIPAFGKLYGITDIVMASNLQSPAITFKVNNSQDMYSGSISANAVIKNPFLIYLLIPFIGLFTAGIFANRRNHSRRLADHVANALGIGILYCLVITFVSLFSGFSFHLSIKEGAIAINTHYSFFKTLLVTLLFGCFFSFLGSLFAVDYRKITGHLADWIPSGEAIHQAIAVPFRGILLISAGLFIYFLIKMADFKEKFGVYFSGTPFEKLIDQSYILLASSAVQFGDYIWNLLHLAPLAISVNAQQNNFSISYGLFSGLSGSGSLMNSSLFQIETTMSQADIDLYLKLAIIFPIALLIWAGFKIGKKPNSLKNLIIFSVLYAVIVTGLAAFSALGFSLSANGIGDSVVATAELGFGIAGIFIKSLFISFAVAYLGTWIHRLKATV